MSGKSNLSAFPINSAVLIYELGSPEFKIASQSQDTIRCIEDILNDMREIIKYGNMDTNIFDFKELEKYNIPQESIRSIIDIVRSCIYKELSSRGINIEC